MVILENNDLFKNIIKMVFFNENNMYNGHHQTILPILEMKELVELVRFLQDQDEEDQMWEITIHPEQSGDLTASIERSKDGKNKQLMFAVEKIIL